MSDFVVHKGRRDPDSFARRYESDVEEVCFKPGEWTQVRLSDGRTGRGACLGCGQPPCMEKDPDELSLPGALEEFPGDPSLDVCPTRALYWDDITASVAIDPERCIGCGLCVARCPYGAIALMNGATATVSVEDPDKLTTSASIHGEHSVPIRSGAIAELQCPAARELPAAVGNLPDTRAALLIRNLLNEVGLNARVKRKGDTNMRIDAVGYSRSERPFVAEIELTTAVLESPRAIIEDVAILHARYGYDVRDIDAVSVALALPNGRSEYYQVIRDVEAVLGVRIKTITVGLLVALLWFQQHLEGFSDEKFGTTDGVDLSKDVGGPVAESAEPYLGAFRPAK